MKKVETFEKRENRKKAKKHILKLLLKKSSKKLINRKIKQKRNEI